MFNNVWCRRLIILLSITLVLSGGLDGEGIQLALAAADVGFVGFTYGDGINGAIAPTGQKPQSKLWYNDGSWWGSLFNQSTGNHNIYRLDWATQSWLDTGTIIDHRTFAQVDTLWDGARLYVATAVRPGTHGSDLSAQILRYSYSVTAKQYTLDAGFPVTIATTAIEAIVFDKDSTGVLWVTYTGDNGAGGKSVYITHSTLGDDRAWVTPYVLRVGGAGNLHADDLSAVVAFNSKIGVMWSNQTDEAMYFAIHNDGDDDNIWHIEPVYQGPRYADDHLNLKSLQADASGQVFAAIKTSHNDASPPNPDDPLIVLLVLKQDGKWDVDNVFGRVGDDHTRPLVLIDNEHRMLYLFGTSPCCNGGAVYYKQASLDAFASGNPFTPGVGTPFIQSDTHLKINNPTSTKQTLNGRTGLVVLASDDSTFRYLHNVINLGSVDIAPPTAAVTAPSEGATVSGTVTISADATDDNAVDHVEFLVNSAVIGTDWTAPYSVSWNSRTFADGPVAIRARATDSGFNTTTSARLTVTVGNPPETTITSGPSGAVGSSSAAFAFSSSEANSTFECSLDGAEFSACISPKQYTGLVDSSHTFEVRAIDPAGNSDPTPASRTWTVDSTLPVTVTFAVEADAHVKQGNPGTNYGTVTSLQVDNNPNTHSYFRFTVSGISGSVQSAKLRVYASGGSTNGPMVYATGSSWSETGLTWSNKPATIDSSTENKGSIPVKTWAEYNVTPRVTGNGAYGFVLVPDSGDGLDIPSRESTSSNKPQLVVTYVNGVTTAPTTPTPTNTPPATNTPTNTPTPTSTPLVTNTATNTPATNTPTNTPPATSTPTPTATSSTSDLLFSDDFESGDLSRWTQVVGLTVQPQQVYAGAYAARGTSTGLRTYARKQLSAPQSEVYYRTRFKIVSQANTTYLLRFRTDADDSILGLYVTAAGKLGYRNDVASASTTSSTLVSLGVWHEVQVRVLVNGTASQTEVWLDGARISALSKTESLGANQIGRIQLGENITGLTYDIAFDDVVVDTRRIGP